ncbi:unnamed protein product [Cylindrotheca closterium]|uniref:PUB domain-containing protein n=1 Tax=Cylindrotheca closterium TaxID=2856 RepID=A0AAD2JMN6_9STRA|nr:unnamed protein product [Cylindrotheca closterium]
MELRKCEELVNELSGLYESLRKASKIKEELLPKLKGVNGEALEGAETDADDSTDAAKTNPPHSLANAVELIHHVQKILQELEPKMDKFQKRLDEKDPISGNPRYGEKTQQRVTYILHIYNSVKQYVPDDRISAAEGTVTNSTDVLLDNPLRLLEKQYLKEQEEHKMQIELEEKQAIEEQTKIAEDERRRQFEAEQKQKQQKEEEERVLREERERLHQQAEQVRQERAVQHRQEQEWFESIQKGPEGVKHYLEKLKQSTSDQPALVHTKAVESLYRIFQQINAHPEETKFRRIRRDHEQFVEDVGRHGGGIEVLIAAGFVLGAIDDVPCYLSIEPNIEKDMDGWSKWFDVNKATFEVLEEAVQNLKSTK